MSHRTSLLSLVASVLLGGLGIYTISFWPLPPKHRILEKPRVDHGVPGVPVDPKDLAGGYSRGWGTASTSLKLLTNNTYSATYHTDIGDAGEAMGRWGLTATQMVLWPSNETLFIVGELRRFDVYRYKTNWVLVSERDREFFEKYGVTIEFTFQRAYDDIQ